ncbi:MAG: SulP family inorganic anion transporter, partial [Bdellovibrionales bacterium]|nr:SulP family inorganic anion transporter [Ramlibacter sp.]
LCVAGLLIPEAVAYAGLAGLPVANALTAALVGLAVYALFGGSRFAIVAPTSSTATMSAAAVLAIPGAFGSANSAAYLQVLMALVLLAGAALMLLAWARQGQLSAFVSRPVLRGFAFALALTIVVKQLPDALGFSLPHGLAADPFHVLAVVAVNLRQWHFPSLLVALAGGALLVLLRRWPQLPASMLVIVLAIAAAAALDLPALGVREVGAVLRPGFHPGFPLLPFDEWLRLGELAVGLVVLIFAESWGSMRTLALAHGDALEPNRELLVLGGANVVSALLQGMAVGAGFSASSANSAAGATSRRAGAIALGVMVLALAFALPLLHLLPRPILAVAVISALWHALSPGPLLVTWRMKRDRLLILASVAAVLCLGVLDGMLVSIALSLADAIRRFSQPVLHELGELGSSRDFVVIDSHGDAVVVPGLLILRPEEPLFFANAERVAADVMMAVKRRPEARCVVLSLEESSDLDSTAAECLLELDKRLADSGRMLVTARVKEGVREVLGYLAPGGIGDAGRMFWSVADAVAWATADLAQRPSPSSRL